MVFIRQIGCVKPNPKPERPSYVKILAPRDMPKRGKAGNEVSSASKKSAKIIKINCHFSKTGSR
jgi:hypothetical protein